MHLSLCNKDNLFLLLCFCNVHNSDEVVRSCSAKKVFLKILQSSQVFPLAQVTHFAKFQGTPFSAEHFQWLLLAFAPIKISYSNTICNKSASEVWICLVSFYGGEQWSERLHFHKYFPQIGVSITFFSKIYI